MRTRFLLLVIMLGACSTFGGCDNSTEPAATVSEQRVCIVNTTPSCLTATVKQVETYPITIVMAHTEIPLGMGTDWIWWTADPFEEGTTVFPIGLAPGFFPPPGSISTMNLAAVRSIHKNAQSGKICAEHHRFDLMVQRDSVIGRTCITVQAGPDTQVVTIKK